MTHALRRILVDLTPLLPGGDNGGAKPLARSLVSELGMLAPQIEFTLLTSSMSYAELADLERPNVHRENVDVDLEVTRAERCRAGRRACGSPWDRQFAVPLPARDAHERRGLDARQTLAANQRDEGCARRPRLQPVYGAVLL